MQNLLLTKNVDYGIIIFWICSNPMIHIGNGNCVVVPITNIIKLKLEKSNQNVITDLERAGIFE